MCARRVGLSLAWTLCLVGLLVVGGNAPTLGARPESEFSQRTGLAPHRESPLPSELRLAGALRLRASGPRERMAAPASISAASELPGTYGRFTRLVYQTWDGTWGLVGAAGDGSDPKHLRYDGFDSESPSVSRGCGDIAFASTRDGNQDIYVMRSDGSGLERLTTDPARDTAPSLSSDSTRVTFVSFRDDDRGEIYVLATSAGVNPVRVTDNQFLDASPAWSPDGQWIAFISDRSGQQNVWLMAADGTAARQITALDHADAPRWSPDAHSIAFASDDTGSGFASLWVVDIDSGNVTLLLRPDGSSPQADLWPCDWSYDGRHLLHETTTWTQDALGWSIASSALDAIDTASPAERIRVVEGGINMAASWAVCDITPPTGRIGRLPKISSSPAMIRWSGSDDMAQDLTYRVQHRRSGATDWVDWIGGETWSSSTVAIFPWDDPGAIVGFRCRARDPVGNVGAWSPAEPEARTVFPAIITGTVSDSRGVPLAGASVVGPPPVRTVAYTGMGGEYFLPGSTEGDYALQAVAPGMARLTLARPGFDHMASIDHFLGTPSVALLNGGFEEQLAGWFASRGAEAELSECGYGSRVAILGPPGVLAAPDETNRQSPAGAGFPELSSKVSAIWQVIEVPADMHEPTLSFVYALGDDRTSSVGELKVVVSSKERSDEHVLLSASEATPWIELGEGDRCPLWRHAYAGLESWAGQTVTITVSYDRMWTSTYARIDEISLAPWLTPVVDRVIPEPGTGAAQRLRVEGSNFLSGGGAGAGPATALVLVSPSGSPASIHELTTSYVDSHTLVALVPSTLPPGLYDVSVRNPTGQRSGVASALVVSAENPVAVPLVVSNMAR